MTNKQYLNGTLIALLILLVPLILLFTPITHGTKPKTIKTDLLQTITGKRSSFHEDVYLYDIEINKIPSSTDIIDFTNNNNKITIEFSEDMDTDFYKVVSRSISYTDGDLSIAESWAGKRVFHIFFDEDTSFESVKLIYHFKSDEGLLVRPVEIIYE